MQDTYDPFSFLLSEIRAHDAGQRQDWDPHLRQHYLDSLLADEAEEIAWGRHHLTVVHGAAADEVQAELLDEVFSSWEDIAAAAEWSRLGGVTDDRLTLTVAGAHADTWLARAADAAHRSNPGHWHVSASASGVCI